MAACDNCSTDFYPEDRYCTHCGSERPAHVAAKEDLQLHAEMPDNVVGGETDQHTSNEVLYDHGHVADRASTMFQKFWSGLKLFWFRHYILVLVSYLSLIGLFSMDWIRSQAGDVGPAIVLAFALASALAWPFALIRSEKTLRAVSVADDWFIRMSHSLANSSSRLGRWLLFPVVWIGGRFMALSRHVPDPFASGSIRVLCYSLTTFVVLALIAFAIAAIIALLMIGLALMVLSFFLGGEVETPRLRSPLRAGRFGQGDILEGKGWLDERKTGRVDEDGNIYEGDSWFNERKVGRVDKDGNVYEGDGWLNEKKVGRVGNDGDVYEGGNWFTEEKVGRVDDEGNVYEGKGWLTEKKVGRKDSDH